MDQIQYLSETFLSFEAYKNNGFISGVKFSITNPSAQGSLYDFFAYLIMVFFGPTRDSALLLNIIAFVFWQLTIYYSINAIYKSKELAILSSTLPLLIIGIWQVNNAASAFDFRLDHLAMCLFGITSFICLLTDNFKNKKWVFYFSVMTSITILCRYLTLVYFSLIFLLLAICLIKKNNQFRNLIASAILVLVLVSPFFYINLDLIYNYYVIGHIIGVESEIRSSGLNLLQTAAFILWNSSYVFFGPLFFLVTGILLSIGIFNNYKINLIYSIKLFSIDKNILFIGIIFFVAPFSVLVMQKEASLAVISIFSSSIILIILSIILPNLNINRPIKKNYLNRIFYIIIGIVFINYSFNILKPQHSDKFISSAKEVDKIADQIFQISKTENRGDLKIATDRITDYLDAQILRVVIYERNGVWLPLEMTLPSGIFSISKNEIINRLVRSDIVILTNEPNIESGFPFDLDMQKNKIVIQQFCIENLQFIESKEVFNRNISIYVKKGLRLRE